MKKIFLFITCCFFAVPQLSYADENPVKLLLRKKINKKYTFLSQIDYRHDDETSRFEHKHYDVGLRIKHKNNWSTSFSYRWMYKYKNKDKVWQLERRPYISIIKKIKIDPITIQLRTRQEFRLRKDNEYGSRNRLRLLLRSNNSLLGVKPFVANEVFYDLRKERYNKNFLLAGFEIANRKYGRYSIYYRHVTTLNKDNNETWNSKGGVAIKALYYF